MRFNMWLKLCLCGLGNIVDHVSVHAKAAYLLIQSYYVLACLSTSNYCIMFVAHFFGLYCLLIRIMMWLFAANKHVYKYEGA